MKPDKPRRALAALALTAAALWEINVHRKYFSQPLATTLVGVVGQAAVLIVQVPVRTLAKWASSGFVIWWAVSQPASAAHVIHIAAVFSVASLGTALHAASAHRVHISGSRAM